MDSSDNSNFEDETMGAAVSEMKSSMDLASDLGEDVADMAAAKLKISELQAANSELTINLQKEKEKVSGLEAKNRFLEEKVAELLRQLGEVKGTNEAATSGSSKTPSPRPQRRNLQTLTVPTEVVEDPRDPDWKPSAYGEVHWQGTARVNITRSPNQETVFPLEGTSTGGCLCVKGKCTTRCRCYKANKPCSSLCKCSISLCTNRRVVETTNTGSENEGE